MLREITKFFLITLSVIILALVLGSSPTPSVTLNTSLPLFQGQRAYQSMWTLAKQFPYRLPWHENRRKAGDWLIQELKNSGYTPNTQLFTQHLKDRVYSDLRNIWVEKKGTRFPNEWVIFLAHYDTVETTVEGAMDNASGTACVLELARTFANIPTERSVIFLFTDSEEYGPFWGSRAFFDQFAHKESILAAISLDSPSVGNEKGILILGDGLHRGYAPAWLRELAIQSTHSFGELKPEDITGVLEIVLRAIRLPAADHGSALQRGIPSLNLVGQPEDFQAQQTDVHHTPNDRAENFKPESFQKYGIIAERILRTLDQMTLPSEAQYKTSQYLKITSHRILVGWAFWLILAAPFFLFFQKAMRFFQQSQSRVQIRNGFIRWFPAGGAFLGTYAVILRLPRLGLIPFYEEFPATQKAPFLSEPNWLVFGIVLGTGALLYVILRAGLKQALRSSPLSLQDELLGMRAITLVILAIVITYTLIFNPCIAFVLLIPAAYSIFSFRALPLCFTSILPVIVLLALLMHHFWIGNPLWYILLGMSYGMFPPIAVIPALLLLSLFFRWGLLGLLEKKSSSPIR